MTMIVPCGESFEQSAYNLRIGENHELAVRTGFVFWCLCGSKERALPKRPGLIIFTIPPNDNDNALNGLKMNCPHL